MTSEIFSLMQGLLGYMLLLSAQLALVLALRAPVARYLGATTAYRLWALPLLWLPLYLFEVPLPDWSSWWRSLLPTTGAQGTVSWFPALLQELELEPAFLRLDLLAADTGSKPYLWQAACGVWFAVMALLLALQLLRVHQFDRALRLQGSAGELPAPEQAQLPAGLQLCFLRGLDSPALFGIVKPRLLLPADFLQRFDARIRPLILQHEAVHYRRRDNVWNLVAMLLRTLFWFNPLLHLAWHRFRLDQELACDEQVLQHSNPDEGRQYARTLLESMSGNTQGRQAATITAWGNLRDLRERTTMIKHRFTHKPYYGAGKVLLALCLLGGGIATISVDGTLPQVLAADETPDRSRLGQDFRTVFEQVMQLRDEGDLTAASALLDTLQQAGINDYEQYTLLLLRANLAQLQEQYAQAIAWYEPILQLDGISHGAHQMTLMQLGNLHYVLEDYAIAVDYYLRFLDGSEDPQPEAVHRLAYTYYHLKDYENGAPYAEQAIQLGRNDRNTYALLRAYYLSMESYPDARRINDRMIELFDDEEARRLNQQLDERGYGAASAASQARPEILPTRTTPPKYPQQAITERIEGHVVVQFGVTEQGSVRDAVVVEAEPADIFDAASLDAIRQFQFPVREENGQAVTTEGVRYVFRYNLSD